MRGAHPSSSNAPKTRLLIERPPFEMLDDLPHRKNAALFRSDPTIARAALDDQQFCVQPLFKTCSIIALRTRRHGGHGRLVSCWLVWYATRKPRSTRSPVGQIAGRIEMPPVFPSNGLPLMGHPSRCGTSQRKSLESKPNVVTGPISTANSQRSVPN